MDMVQILQDTSWIQHSYAQV